MSKALPLIGVGTIHMKPVNGCWVLRAETFLGSNLRLISEDGPMNRRDSTPQGRTRWPSHSFLAMKHSARQCCWYLYHLRSAYITAGKPVGNLAQGGLHLTVAHERSPKIVVQGCGGGWGNSALFGCGSSMLIKIFLYLSLAFTSYSGGRIGGTRAQQSTFLRLNLRSIINLLCYEARSGMWKDNRMVTDHRAALARSYKKRKQHSPSDKVRRPCNRKPYKIVLNTTHDVGRGADQKPVVGTNTLW